MRKQNWKLGDLIVWSAVIAEIPVIEGLYWEKGVCANNYANRKDTDQIV